MKINNIDSIRFRENTLSREMDSSDALLMLRDAGATIKFRQNQEYARKADSVDTNPIIALGYKLVRTFNMLSETNRKDNVQAIDYKA